MRDHTCDTIDDKAHARDKSITTSGAALSISAGNSSRYVIGRNFAVSGRVLAARGAALGRRMRVEPATSWVCRRRVHFS
jgi:frataxin-like iron-binding protein CyaY